MSSKKAQLGMIEMLLVLMILAILIGVGIFVYFQFFKGSIEATSEELERQESEVLLALAASLPELECSRAGATQNCIDASKLLAAQTVMRDPANREIYAGIFGFRNLKAEVIYPLPNDVECTGNTYPNCKTYNLYSNPLPNALPRIYSVITPLYYPESREVKVGKIILEVYRR